MTSVQSENKDTSGMSLDIVVFSLGNTKLISCFADPTDPNFCKYEIKTILVFS